MTLRFVWPLFAALIGFALGGSLVAAIPPPQDQHVQPTDAKAGEDSEQHHVAKTFRETLSIIWDKTWDDPVAFYTFVLSIFTALLAVVSGAQIAFLLRADKTARLSAEAAIQAATALPKLERAYVFFSSVDSADMSNSSPACPAIVRYKYFNHGRTPAIIKAIQVDGRYIRTGFPEPLGSDGGQLPSDIVFSADSESTRNEVPVLIKAIAYQDAKKGIGNIFFWARIDYEDVFGKPHATAMCCEWHFGQDRFIISGGKELNYHT
jgi:hypothetical protein